MGSRVGLQPRGWAFSPPSYRSRVAVAERWKMSAAVAVVIVVAIVLVVPATKPPRSALNSRGAELRPFAELSKWTPPMYLNQSVPLRIAGLLLSMPL